jgi:hypothetical protein
MVRPRKISCSADLASIHLDVKILTIQNLIYAYIPIFVALKPNFYLKHYSLTFFVSPGIIFLKAKDLSYSIMYLHQISSVLTCFST